MAFSHTSHDLQTLDRFCASFASYLRQHTPLQSLQLFLITPDALEALVSYNIPDNETPCVEPDALRDEALLLRSIQKPDRIGGILRMPVQQRYLLIIYTDMPDNENPAWELLREWLTLVLSNRALSARLERSRARNRNMLNEVSALHDISRAFEGADQLDPLLTYIVDKARQLLHAESASLMLHVADVNELEFRVVLGPRAQNVKSFRLPVGRGIAGWVAANKKPLLIEDAYNDPRFDPSFDKRSGYRTRSIVCVPMLHLKKMVGVMTLLNRKDNLPFSEEDMNTLTAFAGQAALAIENSRMLQQVLEKERLDNELKVAARIQQRLIPHALPDIKGLDIAASYIPCKEMSGDFYDIIPLKDGRYAFVVADVSGKGIPAAMLVANMQARLHAYLENQLGLRTVVNRLNEGIIKASTADRYITFYIALYDADSRRLHSLNAGHNPPLLFGNRQLIKLTAGGIFIGSLPWQYQSEIVTLEKDEILVLYTDGLVEAMDAGEREFDETRLIEVVNACKEHCAAEINRRIREAVKAHIQEHPLQDDFTLLVIKRTT
ncbi:MAG: GAF domain-containing protein [Calditrichaeota bacterium]|nr:MAG: GAF domain-containing protein [Calditrichota bacterium]